MKAFLVELYWPGMTPTLVDGLVARIHEATRHDQLAVSYVSCTMTPRDETCFLRFAAAEESAVHGLVERFGLNGARISVLVDVTMDRQKAAVRAHFAALSSGDYTRLDSIHDPDGRNHAPAPFDLSEWQPEGRPYGPAHVRETFDWLRASAPDLKVDIEDLVAEGDRVIAWLRMTGTQTGSSGPIQPTGRKVDFHHAHRFRFRNGLIFEHWAVRDDLRAMVQAGVVVPPGRAQV